MSDEFFLVVGIILAVIGIFCIVVPVMHRISCSGKVMATITEVQRVQSGYWRGITFYQYFPTFVYLVQNKEYITKYELPVKNSKNYKKGEVVEIKYNPKNPESICVGIKKSPYIIGFFFLVIGGALVGIYCKYCL